MRSSWRSESVVLASVVDAVLVIDHLPKLGPYLVATLPALDVQDFSHFLGKVTENGDRRERERGIIK